MRRGRRRGLVAAAAGLAAAAVLSACDAASLRGERPSLEPGQGLLVLRQEVRGGGPVPDSTYIRVDGGTGVVLRERMGTGEVVRAVSGGSYDVVSWQQACGGCPATDRCSARLSVRPEEELRVVVLLGPDPGCSIVTA
ncbi:MAG: hypothetical protein HY658_10040 [Actinobacteria bacterium]|nr:hypothetical protein [Actinomycetota bacterium]